MCAHIAAHEIDGPSLHPSTQHLYTLLMPPHLDKGVSCGQGRLPPRSGRQPRGSLLCQSASLSCRNRGFVFNTFRLLRGQLGNGGGRGMTTSLGGGGQRTWRTVRELPSGACTNSLPLILPWLAVLSVIPQPLTTLLPSSASWPILVNPAPGKKEKGSVTKARLSHKAVKEQSKRQSNTKQKRNT